MELEALIRQALFLGPVDRVRKVARGQVRGVGLVRRYVAPHGGWPRGGGRPLWLSRLPSPR